MNPTTLGWIAALLAVGGGGLLIAALMALVRLRPVTTLTRLLTGALLLSCGALVGTFALGVAGYRALTLEQSAARIEITPIGPQQFTARFRFADGGTAAYTLTGDEIYVDARILKWTPWANLMGLHTAYALDRVAGRFRDIAQERTATRTVFPLRQDAAVDLFALRARFAQLAFWYDTEYGSASFVPADRARTLDLRVSTTGLLLREVPPSP